MPSTRGALDARIAAGRRVAARAATLGIALALAFACVSRARTRRVEESPQTPRLAEPPSKSLLESERPEPANSEDVEFDEAELPDASATGPYARESFGIYRCATNRPSVCDALVSPVCARRLVSPHDDAGAETVANYSNGCLACSDPSVVSYVFGRCDYRRPSTLAAPTATTEKR